MPTATTTKLPNGYEFTCLPHSEYIVQEVWTEHCYDTDFTIHPGSVIVDIGANQGVFALYAASKGARVYAFEPEPTNFELLVRNIRANGLEDRIVAHNLAVTETEGEALLFVPRSDDLCDSGLVTGSSAQRDILLQQYGETAIASIRCPSTTLAKILDTMVPGAAVDLLKIDCEGAEIAILGGATSKHSARVRNLVLETHATYDERDLCRLVHEHGFVVTNFRKVAGKPLPNGYLFATRDAAAVPYPHPVAILRAPTIAHVGEDFVLDASTSFWPGYPGRQLMHRFRIDGVPSTSTSPVQKLPEVASGGPHDIAVTVSGDGHDDTARTTLWYAEPRAESVQYLEAWGQYAIALAKTACDLHFAIPKAHLPPVWVDSVVCVDVALSCPDLPNDGKEITSFGEEERQSEHFRKIRFRHFVPLEDLHFRFVNVRPNTAIAVVWWNETAYAPPEPARSE